jgi:hypothetical protein
MAGSAPFSVAPRADRAQLGIGDPEELEVPDHLVGGQRPVAVARRERLARREPAHAPLQLVGAARP